MDTQYFITCIHNTNPLIQLTMTSFMYSGAELYVQ